MASVADIRDALKAVLEGASKTLTVKHWFKGDVRKEQITGFPYGFIQWAGGQKTAPISIRAEINDAFYIVIVCRHVDSEKAEDQMLTLLETLEALILAHEDLSGLVEFAWISNRETYRITDEQDYSVVAVRATVSTRRLG